MIKEGLVEQLKSVSEFFERSTSCLSEEDSGFQPEDGTFTVAQQVAHTAQTIEWFVEGMFDSNGFDLNFEDHMKVTMACNSISSAREWFGNATAKAIEVIGQKSDEELPQISKRLAFPPPCSSQPNSIEPINIITIMMRVISSGFFISSPLSCY